jgi:hypothetical protein
MTPAQIETRITESFERTRPYVPILAQRLALVYLLPMTIAVLVSTVGSRLLLSLLPELPMSTATLIILAINLFLLIRGWQWLEKRYEGTKLFLMYNLVSRHRRDLKRLAAQSPMDHALVNAALQQLQQAEQGFISAAGAVQTAKQ